MNVRFLSPLPSMSPSASPFPCPSRPLPPPLPPPFQVDVRTAVVFGGWSWQEMGDVHFLRLVASHGLTPDDLEQGFFFVCVQYIQMLTSLFLVGERC